MSMSKLSLKEKMKRLDKSISNLEKYRHDVLGFPIRTKEEISLQRKKLYEEIVKNTSKIDAKCLLKEVKNIIKILEIV